MRVILHELALPTFHRFARRWGYAVLAEDLPTDGAGADPSAQQAKWAKIRLLREALATFPLALWLDADILLTRDDEDIASHLHPDHFQALVMEHVPYEHRVNPNTGVWLMRSCPSAFAFLNAVRTAGPQPGPWADQGAVLAALDWDRGDERYYWARPGRGNQFLAGTSWLPPGWNQPYLGGRTDENVFNSSAQSYADRPVVSHPHALHFMGMSPAARYRHMAAVAKALPIIDVAPGMGSASPTPVGWRRELVGQQVHQQPIAPVARRVQKLGPVR
jgi:galactosyl transferase GMA12/MNN10 family